MATEFRLFVIKEVEPNKANGGRAIPRGMFLRPVGKWMGGMYRSVRLLEHSPTFRVPTDCVEVRPFKPAK